MSDKDTQASTRTSSPVYQITVQGSLKEDWQDWFNGMLIATRLNPKSSAKTTVICKVRDQAELIGIINWLHNMNLVLEEVILYSEEKGANDELVG